MSQSTVSARSDRSNVIPFPMHLRRPQDPLATPELEPHEIGLCELSYSIASEIVGGSPDNDEELHERVREEVLGMLCQLTPVLLDGLRARWAV
jgi:hypothetical protein